VKRQHPPCEVCGCQNVVNLANAIADAVMRRQELEERIDSDLAADHIRGPLHDGSHPDCLVCEPLRKPA
jgi:hypothetical protein